MLDPFADLVTREGADLLWIGMPTVRDPGQNLGFASLNRLYGEQARGRLDVDFVDAGDYLNGPTGGYAAVLPGPAGAPERVRRADAGGMHLCPPGVVRLADPILAWIADRYPVRLAPNWESASWRFPPQLEDPVQCPPPDVL